MADILVSRRAGRAQDILGFLPESDLNQVCTANALSRNSWVLPGTPVSLSADGYSTEVAASFNTLTPAEKSTLQQLVAYTDSESIALAAFINRYFSDKNLQRLDRVIKQFSSLGSSSSSQSQSNADSYASMNSMIGAAATAAGERLSQFEQVVLTYQVALNRVTKLSGSGYGRGHAEQLTKAKRLARLAYEKLQTAYPKELARYAPLAIQGKNRGDALAGYQRGITLAERAATSSKGSHRLNIVSKVQASELGKASKTINHLGTVALAVDAGLRVNKVHDVAESGGDWMRESAKQVTGFGTGAAVGTATGRVTFAAGMAGAGWVAAQAGLTLAGPVGWAVMGVVFAGSLVAGYFAGQAADNFGQEKAASIYDSQ
ncbi:hypothetical protein [Oceanobacter mangrovi]|uniref:hypothetical protein n=1 Tax=Oceanobacter mangrovi TaxID=2862510 RepID=UPI001C8CFD54|nr:hypothetical protein [Oceanobacter mangrovi]